MARGSFARGWLRFSLACPRPSLRSGLATAPRSSAGGDLDFIFFCEIHVPLLRVPVNEECVNKDDQQENDYYNQQFE